MNTDDEEPYDATPAHAARTPYRGHPVGALRAELDAQLDQNPATAAAEMAEQMAAEHQERKEERGLMLENPEDRARRDPITGLTTAQMAFLVAFRLCPSNPLAAKRAGISISTVTRWRDKSPEFRAAYADAFEAARGALFASMWVSAVEGDIEPVYQGGLCVGHKRKYSDRMRELLAKATMPEMFDRKAAAGAAMTVNIKATTEQIADVVRRFSPTRKARSETVEAQAEVVERPKSQLSASVVQVPEADAS